jgi:hypothetical protein
MTSEVDHLGPQIVGAVRAGLSLADAADQAGVAEQTVRGWAKKGRAGQDRFAAFAHDLDGAREVDDGAMVVPGGPLDRAGLFLLVSKSARAGSVQAMKLALEMIREGRTGHRAGRRPVGGRVRRPDEPARPDR